MSGEEVKIILKKNGVVMKDLAIGMDVSPQHLTSILKSPDITTSKLLQISEITGIKQFGLFNLSNKLYSAQGDIGVVSEGNQNYNASVQHRGTGSVFFETEKGTKKDLKLENEYLKREMSRMQEIIDLQNRIIGK